MADQEQAKRWALVAPDGKITDIKPLGARFEVAQPFKWVPVPDEIEGDDLAQWNGEFLRRDQVPSPIAPPARTPRNLLDLLTGQERAAFLQSLVALRVLTQERAQEILAGSDMA